MLTVGAEVVLYLLVQNNSDFKGSDNRLGLSGRGYEWSTGFGRGGAPGQSAACRTLLVGAEHVKLGAGGRDSGEQRARRRSGRQRGVWRSDGGGGRDCRVCMGWWVGGVVVLISEVVVVVEEAGPDRLAWNE